MTSNELKIRKIVTKKIQSILTAASTSGFAAKEFSGMNLDEVTYEGIELIRQDETAPLRGAKCSVTVSLTVTETCCNMSGNMHGGFTATLIDMASSLPLLALSGHDRWSFSGVSSNINVYYIAAAPLGMKIRVISTVLQQGKTSATIEARVEEVGTGKLIAVGTHVKQDVVFKGRSKL